MWIYYYINKARIAQLSEQIATRLPFEQVKKWELQGSAKASAEGETSRLLEMVGLKGKASAEAEADLTRSGEEKFTRTDEETVERVRQHLLKHAKYSELSTNSTPGDANSLHSLVRFCGDFSPNIPGKDAERFAHCLEQTYLVWQGTCGQVPLTFVTSKNSLVSPTALSYFLSGEVESLRLDGFATLLETGRHMPLAILPLFFGREVDSVK